MDFSLYLFDAKNRRRPYVGTRYKGNLISLFSSIH